MNFWRNLFDSSKEEVESNFLTDIWEKIKSSDIPVEVKTNVKLRTNYSSGICVALDFKQPSDEATLEFDCFDVDGVVKNFKKYGGYDLIKKLIESKEYCFSDKLLTYFVFLHELGHLYERRTVPKYILDKRDKNDEIWFKSELTKLGFYLEDGSKNKEFQKERYNELQQIYYKKDVERFANEFALKYLSLFFDKGYPRSRVG